MDLTFDHQWRALLKGLSSTYGEDLDLNSILFLIGVQELGQDIRKYGKQEKLELMHVAVCTLLEPFGYYSAQGRDNEGWPHFKKNKGLPALNSEFFLVNCTAAPNDGFTDTDFATGFASATFSTTFAGAFSASVAFCSSA